MASELSQLIESELRKAEGANKPDEHQRRLASLRVKVRLVIVDDRELTFTRCLGFDVFDLCSV